MSRWLVVRRRSYTILLLLNLFLISPLARGQEEQIIPTKLYVVRGLAPGDFLNHRSDASASSEVLQEIPANATNLRATGRTRYNGETLWAEITYNDQIGWVNAGYLQRADTSKGVLDTKAKGIEEAQEPTCESIVDSTQCSGDLSCTYNISKKTCHTRANLPKCEVVPEYLCLTRGDCTSSPPTASDPGRCVRTLHHAKF